MLTVRFFQVAVATIVIGCCVHSAHAGGEREGESAGVFFNSVTASIDQQIEGKALKITIPIHYSSYDEGTYIDMATDVAGWILLASLTSLDPPEFDTDSNFSLTDVNIAYLRFGTDLLGTPLPLIIGGQGGFGYKGISSKAKARSTTYKEDAYASCGLNTGTSLEFADQFLQVLFFYDWIYMADHLGNNAMTLQMEYFPFPASSEVWKMTRLRVFAKRSTIDFTKNISADKDYTDLQIGAGIILNLPF